MAFDPGIASVFREEKDIQYFFDKYRQRGPVSFSKPVYEIGTKTDPEKTIEVISEIA